MRTHEEHLEAKTLCSVLSNCFAILIADAASSENSWRERMNSLRLNGLLINTMPNPVQTSELEVDQERLSDSRYRNRLIAQLKKARPGKVILHHLEIDRSRVNDDGYLRPVAELIAANWLFRLAPIDSLLTFKLLLGLDAQTIGCALDELHPADQTASTIARFALKRISENIIDNDSGLKAIIERLNAAVARIAAEASSELNIEIEKIALESKARCAALLEQEETRFAECQGVVLSSWLEAKHSFATLRANFANRPSIEEAFRASMAERKRRGFRYSDCADNYGGCNK